MKKDLTAEIAENAEKKRSITQMTMLGFSPTSGTGLLLLRRRFS